MADDTDPRLLAILADAERPRSPLPDYLIQQQAGGIPGTALPSLAEHQVITDALRRHWREEALRRARQTCDPHGHSHCWHRP